MLFFIGWVLAGAAFLIAIHRRKWTSSKNIIPMEIITYTVLTIAGGFFIFLALDDMIPALLPDWVSPIHLLALAVCASIPLIGVCWMVACLSIQQK